MKFPRGLVLAVAFLLFACQPTTPRMVTILEDEHILVLATEERVPSALLDQAGIILHPQDQILVNGLPASPEQPISEDPAVIQVRRAMAITLVTPQGEQQIQTAAFTLGQALAASPNWLRAEHHISYTLDTPVSRLRSPVFITMSRDLTITVNDRPIQVASTAQTVGEALAEAGIPLLGLDYSVPAESEPIPSNGQIKVVRVSESLLLAQKPIPFESELQASAEVPLDQTQILQPGETGLSVQRIRIRYEDGKEMARFTENETLVRPAKTRIMGYGTKVEIKTATVDGVQIEYWRAVQMYATSYSPCRSGTDACHSGTASGKSLKKGMVGLRSSWYLAMGGQPLYIPGYGYATVEDICGGCTGKPWIDLGYSDGDYQAWHSWVTVYFLTPVPSTIIYTLE